MISHNSKHQKSAPPKESKSVDEESSSSPKGKKHGLSEKRTEIHKSIVYVPKKTTSPEQSVDRDKYLMSSEQEKSSETQSHSPKSTSSNKTSSKIYHTDQRTESKKKQSGEGSASVDANRIQHRPEHGKSSQKTKHHVPHGRESSKHATTDKQSVCAIHTMETPENLQQGHNENCELTTNLEEWETSQNCERTCSDISHEKHVNLVACCEVSKSLPKGNKKKIETIGKNTNSTSLFVMEEELIETYSNINQSQTREKVKAKETTKSKNETEPKFYQDSNSDDDDIVKEYIGDLASTEIEQKLLKPQSSIGELQEDLYEAILSPPYQPESEPISPVIFPTLTFKNVSPIIQDTHEPFIGDATERDESHQMHNVMNEDSQCRTISQVELIENNELHSSRPRNIVPQSDQINRELTPQREPLDTPGRPTTPLKQCYDSGIYEPITSDEEDTVEQEAMVSTEEQPMSVTNPNVPNFTQETVSNKVPNYQSFTEAIEKSVEQITKTFVIENSGYCDATGTKSKKSRKERNGEQDVKKAKSKTLKDLQKDWRKLKHKCRMKRLEMDLVRIKQDAQVKPRDTGMGWDHAFLEEAAGRKTVSPENYAQGTTDEFDELRDFLLDKDDGINKMPDTGGKHVQCSTDIESEPESKSEKRQRHEKMRKVDYVKKPSKAHKIYDKLPESYRGVERKFHSSKGKSQKDKSKPSSKDKYLLEKTKTVKLRSCLKLKERKKYVRETTSSRKSTLQHSESPDTRSGKRITKNIKVRSRSLSKRESRSRTTVRSRKRTKRITSRSTSREGNLSADNSLDYSSGSMSAPVSSSLSTESSPNDVRSRKRVRRISSRSSSRESSRLAYSTHSRTHDSKSSSRESSCPRSQKTKRSRKKVKRITSSIREDLGYSTTSPSSSKKFQSELKSATKPVDKETSDKDDGKWRHQEKQEMLEMLNKYTQVTLYWCHCCM